ncbi:MAG: hypothetical protein ACTHMX_17340, partial [Thermomicrobiales bacterium]
MRIAALIVGLLVSLWVFFESMLVGSLFHAFGARHEAEIIAIGLIIGIVGLVASALVFVLPQWAMVLFAGCGVCSFLVARNTNHGNQWTAGALFLLVAVFAWFGWQEKRENPRDRARHRPQPIAPQGMSGHGESACCPGCGLANSPGANF